MKKIFNIMIALTAMVSASAQETVYPAKPQEGAVLIKNGTIHVGNGTLLENASIRIEAGKITAISKDLAAGDARVIDATGKHVYPGLILANSDLGLTEIPTVRASNDVSELHLFDPLLPIIQTLN